MSLSGMPHWGRRRAVTRPGLDREGIETVARFIADGWAVSECALVVATAAHQRRIDGALRRWGHDPDELRRQLRYTCVDADVLIAQAVVEGEFNPELFGKLADDLVVRAGDGGRRVRAFGEVVARLWQRDQVTAALAVERQWHGLLRDHDFALLSASAATASGPSALLDVRRICDLHTDLDGRIGAPVDAPLGLPPGLQLIAPVDLSGIGRHPDHACSRVYLPVPESVPAARRFVVEVLAAWGDRTVTADAAIVASELVTNALLHAGSPFRVVLDRRDDCVRIGVEDGARESPDLRTGGSEDLDGRGVAIIDALSRRWGSTSTLAGKVVWAELPRPPAGTSARSPRSSRPPRRSPITPVTRATQETSATDASRSPGAAPSATDSPQPASSAQAG